MVALLPSPELQFLDADGIPYAGGTLATYVPGTTTLKQTWSESTGTTLNTNPIVLDSAGRCIVYADGAVRLILKDASGNTIFDQPSNTLVSVAMAPVCIAPDLATAKGLLGIVDETGALATLTSGLAAANTAITAETTRATAAEATLATGLAAANAAITAETARAEAAEAALGGSGLKSGVSGASDVNGHVRVTFATPFATACTSFIPALSGGGLFSGSFTVNPDRFGADVWICMPWGAAAQAGLYVYWIATGI